MNDALASSGLVVVDKPAGMTSHDVVSALRRAFGTRKVGHAGTLDPAATGVLIAGINRGTKFLNHLIAADKRYLATVRLGMTTSTDDAEGEVLSRADQSALNQLDSDTIRSAFAAQVGEIMQRPAKVSAIKIDGKRAYERIRAGEDVDIPARRVTIFSLDVLALRVAEHNIDVDIAVHCSSGTYIRSIARDVGDNLTVGGHLIALRRQSVGEFTLTDATPLSDIQEQPALSLSLDAALVRCYPRLDVSSSEAHALSMGKQLNARGLNRIHAAVSPDGRAVALVKDRGRKLVTVFVARPATL